MTILLAIDLGTSFIKAGAYDLESRCVSTAAEPVKDYRPAPGMFIQKGEELLGSVINCVKQITVELGERAKDVVAVSFTGQMSGFMGVDAEWRDITGWSCSLDSRYMSYAEKQMETLRDKFLETGGTNFPQMAPKYEWFKTEFPEESKRIVKYLMVSGYVIGRLGELPIDEAAVDRSYTEWTGLADVGCDRWSGELCRAVGLDEKYLPRIVTSNTVCGWLSERWARETGLKSGIPLVSGAGDKAAGALGAAIVEHGDAIFEASSYGMVSVCVGEYRPDMAERRFDIVPSAVPGDFYAAHFAAGSGVTLDWFMNNFARRPGQSAKEMFAEMEEKVAALPVGSEGVFAIGLPVGSSMPLDGDLKGLFMGYDWSHRPEHFYRALLESFTYDFTLAMEAVERMYPELKIDDVRIIGGGAKSPVWTQMCADAQGKRYHTLSREDAAMWGASILAGSAIGAFTDLKATAKKYVKPEKEYLPNAARRAEYAKYARLYAEYMTELSGFFKRLREAGR